MPINTNMMIDGEGWQDQPTATPEPEIDERQAEILETKSFLDDFKKLLDDPNFDVKKHNTPVVVTPIVTDSGVFTSHNPVLSTPTQPALPQSAITPVINKEVVPIKSGTPQFVLFNDDAVPIDVITDLIFENIGGTELLSISRHDTVNGQSVAYQPIKNLKIINQEFNANNIIRLQDTSDTFFATYPIKLNDKTPVVGHGPSGDSVYIDSTGSLVLEFINLLEDEHIEIQITTSGTIYEVGE